MTSRWNSPDPIKEPTADLLQLDKSKPPPQPVRLLESGMLDVSYVEGEMLYITERNAKTSLLRLPAELRDTIWKFVLGGRHYVLEYSLKSITHEANGQPTCRAKQIPCTHKNYLALSQVCRQTYAETTLLPFKLNPFHFYSNDDIAWAAELPEAQRGAIVEVHLMTDHRVTMRSCGGADEPVAFPAELFPGFLRVVVHDMSKRLRTFKDQKPMARVLRIQKEIREDIRKGREHIQVDFIG